MSEQIYNYSNDVHDVIL